MEQCECKLKHNGMLVDLDEIIHREKQCELEKGHIGPHGLKDDFMDDFPPDDQKLISVTTALNILDKPGLLYWAAEHAARAAVDERDIWEKLDRHEAIRWLSNARFRQSGEELSATELGTVVHSLIEHTVRDNKVPTFSSSVLSSQMEAKPFLERFGEWLDKVQPEFLYTEIPIFNLYHGYAGTCDAIGKINGKKVIIDYKTTRKSFTNQGKPTKPYPEASLQIAAYRQGEVFLEDLPARKEEDHDGRSYLFGAREEAAASPLPIIEGGYVVHITPDHCNAHPVSCGSLAYRIFLNVLEVAKAKQGHLWKQAIGEKI